MEHLAELEHDPMISYAKEGVFAIYPSGGIGERLGPVEYVLSSMLEAQGITWKWFPENHGFGNGITVPKTTALKEYQLVDHRTGNSIPDLLTKGYPLELGKLIIRMVPKRTEGWDKYEARWVPGTCLQESHIVHLTQIVTRGRLDTLAYNRIQRIIEDPSAMLTDVDRYREKDFSPTRTWDGKKGTGQASQLLKTIFG